MFVVVCCCSLIMVLFVVCCLLIVKVGWCLSYVVGGGCLLAGVFVACSLCIGRRC